VRSRRVARNAKRACRGVNVGRADKRSWCILSIEKFLANFFNLRRRLPRLVVCPLPSLRVRARWRFATPHDSRSRHMAWIAVPEPHRIALEERASTSGGATDFAFTSSVNLLRDLLSHFFTAYLEDAPEVRKPLMSHLLAHARACGLIGDSVLPGLASLFHDLRTELNHGPEKFAAFYHFIFFVARDEGQRNLSKASCQVAWRFVLGNGRFALLDLWLTFVNGKDLGRGVSEDTWCQVLDFAAMTIGGLTIRDYDPHGAWPVLVDEFVDFLRGGSQSVNTRNAESPESEQKWRVSGWGDRDRDSGWGVDCFDTNKTDRNDHAMGTGGQILASAEMIRPVEWGGGEVAGDGGACGTRNVRASSAEHRHHQPTATAVVGCKRRLSAVLEMDGLATQLVSISHLPHSAD